MLTRESAVRNPEASGVSLNEGVSSPCLVPSILCGAFVSFQDADLYTIRMK